MRVLQLGPYPPPHGGVQSNLVGIRSYLRKRNIPCSVINITRHRKLDADDVYYPKSAGELVRLLWRLEYDILHLHLGGMLTNRLLALGAVCSATKSKTVLTFHSGGYPSSPEGKTAKPFSWRGFVLRRFDRLIGVNPEIINFFQRLGVPEDRMRLIYPHAFSVQDDSVELPEALSLFLRRHHPIFISVGLLEPEYDLPLQLEGIEKVRETLPDAGLMLIGSGSLEQELRNRIAAKKDAQHMLLCGDVAHDATMRCIRQATAMLRTTLYDGDAVSVREALHLGTPVIASDNGMRPAGVKLIPKQDLQALCAAMLESTKSETGFRSAPSADESNLEAVFNVYQELMGARSDQRTPAVAR
jgi:glycogen synthase